MQPHDMQLLEFAARSKEPKEETNNYKPPTWHKRGRFHLICLNINDHPPGRRGNKYTTDTRPEIPFGPRWKKD